MTRYLNKFIIIFTAVLMLYFLIVIFSFDKKTILINEIGEITKLSQKSLIKPKICEPKVFEVNLSKNLIYFFENCKLKEIIPIAYQGPEGKWYQTPTGYFRVGIKKEKHISSLFSVYMNYAVQMYEDFFIHEIPYYLNGQPVTSNFSGGCIRLTKENAIKFYKLTNPGDLIISYKELDPNKFKNYLYPPINLKEFYIRQRFNNPIRVKWENATNPENRKNDYIQHAGLDLAPLQDARDLNVYSIYDGEVVKIVENGKDDHGLGNSVIIKLDNSICNFEKELCKNINELYVLYGHLENINVDIKEGQKIKKGYVIGKIGATGYGCNYWRIGEDGCDKKSPLDKHLHLEIKIKPVLESPIEALCYVNGEYKNCFGYAPDNPEKFGYVNPMKFLFRD